jgi:hypothetical protein
VNSFSLYPLRFSFRARESLRFPAGAAANLLRGAFGSGLHSRAGLYARLFRPRAAGGPSGFLDPPRPFVIRAAHLDGRTIQPGQPFHFDFYYFDLQRPQIPAITEALAGIRRVELTAVEGDRPLTLSLDPPDRPVQRGTVRFLTPTELKIDGGLARQPEFPLLACRIRDRIGALRSLYGEGPLELDFRGFAGRAAAVRMTRCDLRHVQAQRRSRASGQTHPLGGFTGEAGYQGDLTEFVPFLQAARWTGVGRQTVWGKGALEFVECG